MRENEPVLTYFADLFRQVLLANSAEEVSAAVEVSINVIKKINAIHAKTLEEYKNLPQAPVKNGKKLPLYSTVSSCSSRGACGC